MRARPEKPPTQSPSFSPRRDGGWRVPAQSIGSQPHPEPGSRRRHPSIPALLFLLLLAGLAASCAGCQVLVYTGPNGERFTRRVLGASTAFASLTLETGTNGLRRLEIRGYQSDSAQAFGTITEAAVRAAVSAARP